MRRPPAKAEWLSGVTRGAVRELCQRVIPGVGEWGGVTEGQRDRGGQGGRPAACASEGLGGGRKGTGPRTFIALACRSIRARQADQSERVAPDCILRAHRAKRLPAELLEEVALIIAIDTFPLSRFVAEGTCTTASGAVPLQICEVLARMLIHPPRSSVPRTRRKSRPKRLQGNPQR